MQGSRNSKNPGCRAQYNKMDQCGQKNPLHGVEFSIGKKTAKKEKTNSQLYSKSGRQHDLKCYAVFRKVF